MPSFPEDLMQLRNESDALCLCGSGHSYSDCCLAFHQGASYPDTAEKLMRSRYVAFAKCLQDYLLKTWAEETRPAQIEFEAELSWQKLTILKCKKGRSQDKRGWVTFAAEYQIGLERHRMLERSEFKRDDNGYWVYLGGEFE